ncbi:MAG: hypothetical protein WBV89_04750, partial [Ilumatobacter sp.]
MTATTRLTSRRRIRRNRISGTDAIAVGVVAAITGIAAAFAGTHPTAWGPSDVILTAQVAFSRVDTFAAGLDETFSGPLDA